ncbi:acyltransferase family protein [Streptomyces sp. TR02-1]|uniref:acyltransferase family protein n=1 Tax=Streptomyces sp. TR02-1 TaxID=3385977 RepID=UPI0039A3968B
MPGLARRTRTEAEGTPLPGGHRREAATGAHPPAGPLYSGSGREPYFDNAKYLALVLVACAHGWEPYLAEHRTVLALYDLVYTFHMPVFVVVSGYFSRNIALRPWELHRLVAGLLLPYLFFEVLYAHFRRWAAHDPSYPVNVIDPQFLDWFLLALFLWRLSAPVWRIVRRPLPVAVGIAVLASVTPGIGPDLDLQRVLQFLPFFVLGTLLRPAHFDRLRGRRVRAAAVAVAAAASAAAYWAAPRLDHAWLYHRDSAQALGASTATGVAAALALLGCSAVLTGCFLAWVPRRRTWYTGLGAATLYGYLLHGFLVKGAAARGWYEPAWLGTPAGMVLVTAAAALAVTALCTPPVRRLVRPLVEPRAAWLLRDPASPEEGPLSAQPRTVGP